MRSRPADDLELWLLEQSHPTRRRARRLQYTAYGLAALIGTGATVGAVAAGVAVFESAQSHDRAVVATTSAEGFLAGRNFAGDRLRWAAPIKWTDETGKAYKGVVEVSSQLPAGAKVPAGLSPQGVLRQEPVPFAEAGLRGLLTAAAVGVTGALAVRVIVPRVKRRAENARVQSWETAWIEWNPVPRSQET